MGQEIKKKIICLAGILTNNKKKSSQAKQFFIEEEEGAAKVYPTKQSKRISKQSFGTSLYLEKGTNRRVQAVIG